MEDFQKVDTLQKMTNTMEQVINHSQANFFTSLTDY